MIDRLHYISAPFEEKGHVEVIAEALEGGCKWIQLRMKNMEVDEMNQLVEQAQVLCLKYEAKLLINDHVQLAKAFGVDGVHLGKEDMPPAEARAILGDDFIIGSTANTIEDIRELGKQPIDYIGLGPFRYTTTKEKLSPVLGVEGYREILSEMKRQEINIPVIAIGGIVVTDVLSILSTGVYGIAISGLINQSENKKETIHHLYKLLA